MAQKGLNLILTGFMFLIIGIVLLSSVADSVFDATTLSSSTNESVDIAGGLGEAANDDIEGVSYFGNATLNTNQAHISFDVEVNWTTNGSLTVAGGYFNDTSYDFTYEYQGDNYVDESTSRSLITLVTLFFAIAVMLGGLVIAVEGFKNAGIL